MPEIIGYDDKVYKQFTCTQCGAIVRYKPTEVTTTDRTDEGTTIKGLNCPGCGEFRRTNP